MPEPRTKEARLFLVDAHAYLHRAYHALPPLTRKSDGLPVGAVSGVFLIGYGGFRFLVEFTREPDGHLGLLSLGMSMGQWLSLPMVIAGILLMRHSQRRAA